MPPGVISNPAVWLLGTVVSPAWCQAVQDNINGAGGVTFASIVMDGSGGASASASVPGNGHIVDVNPLNPTKTNGSGAGTSPSIAVNGTDFRGNILVVTGTTPTASAGIVTVNFRSVYPNPIYVFLSPNNQATAALSGTSAIYVSSGVAFFQLVAGSLALTASTTYSWNYLVIG